MKGLKHIAVIALLGGAVLSACKENANERFSREAREFTKKSCPTMINETVRLDSMTYDATTHTVGYHYTLQHHVQPTARDRQIAKRDLIAGIKNSTMIRAYKDEDCNFRYCYHSADDSKVIVYDITIAPEEYKTGSAAPASRPTN